MKPGSRNPPPLTLAQVDMLMARGLHRNTSPAALRRLGGKVPRWILARAEAEAILWSYASLYGMVADLQGAAVTATAKWDHCQQVVSARDAELWRAELARDQAIAAVKAADIARRADAAEIDRLRDAIAIAERINRRYQRRPGKLTNDELSARVMHKLLAVSRARRPRKARHT